MNIIYLDLDTLRPDHMGCYGYHRNTTPNIDALAAEGVRYTNYYCSDSPCLPSRTALASGRFGIHTGVVTHGGTAADFRYEGPSRGFRSRLDHESLAGHLKTRGYYTTSISPFAERHGAWQFYAGFDEMLNTGRQGMEGAEEVYPVAEDWLRRNADRDDWFLHLNFWDPHMPYRAPEEFGNPFEEEPLPDWLTEEAVASHFERVGIMMPHKKQDAFARYARGGRRDRTVAERYLPPYPRSPLEIRDLSDVRAIIDGYDCGIAYMDTYLGRLFDLLQSLGVWEETAICISADHGENLGELGIYGDHITADYVTHHIPMVIRWPGGAAGSVDSALHYNLDLAPTIADLLGGSAPEVWDGRSYAPSVLGGTHPTTARASTPPPAVSTPPRAATANNPTAGTQGAPVSSATADRRPWGELVLSQGAGTCQRGVRFDNWYYIRTLHDGYNLFPRDMLFDTDADPFEQRDLVAEKPEVVREAVYRLQNWHDDMMRSMPPGYATDPLWTIVDEGGPSHVRGNLPGYLEFLEENGHTESARLLRERHPREVG